MKKFLIFIFASFSLFAITPDEALKKLMEGNQRYLSDNAINIGQLQEKRKESLLSQEPFATIVGCSDSRVPPEIIFDQNLGDIFVVRVAGNIVGPIEMDSVEYSVGVVHSPLILVLGHQNCGAVQAVVEGKGTSEDIAHIVPFIQKAVDQSKNLPGDRLANAIKTNVKITVQNLKKNSILAPFIKKNKLKIVGGYYELGSGKVELLKE